MKILFIGEQVHGPWEKMWANALEKFGFTVKYISLLDYNRGIVKLFGTIHYYSPDNIKDRIKDIWDIKFNRIITDELLFNKYDYFMCYNDCRLFPSTIDLIKKHVKKLIVLLGDNPFFYNKDKRYFLYLIEKSDIIISADKTTINYLNLYHKTTLFYPAGTDNSVFFPVVPNRFELNLYSCDILFVGTGYGNNSFGYHRARVLSEIADFNIKIYGDKHWKKHISFFPKLRDKIIYKKLSQFELNIAHNCTKIVIVPTNAWLVNGIPTRVFDALASGTFVIAEHRELYDEIFPDKIVPTYKSVNELKSVVSYYLLHDNERINKVNKSRNIVISNYLVKHNVSKFIEYL